MKVEFKQTPTGEVAIIPRAEYDRLKQLSDEEAAEDIGTAKLIARSKKDKGPLLPLAVVQQLANGENPIKVLRKFRGMTQAELATSKSVQITQNYLSDLEKGKRKGPIELHRKIARALSVPLDFLDPVVGTDTDAHQRPARRKPAVSATSRSARKR
jgi:DNA-binding XRE family transcriptional regulator